MTRRAFTTDDGVRLVYEDSGPPEGTSVVLCHGLAAARQQFAADAEYFAAQGHRVLVPDVRGHGQSGRPPSYDMKLYTIGRMARDMFAMLDDAGVGPVHWVGNSLGGIIALEMVGREPERFRSLATFGTAYALDLPWPVAGSIPVLYRTLGARLMARITARMTTPDPDARKLVAGILHDFDPKVGRAVAENVRRYDLIQNAARFKGPVLLICGSLDRLVNRALPQTLRAMREHPDFEVVDLPDAGHGANLDRPDQVRRILTEFWTRIDGR